jgi:uncharacterized protein YacL
MTSQSNTQNPKKSNIQKWIILRGVVIGAAALWMAYFYQTHALQFQDLRAQDIPALLGYLFLITLISERAIEFLLSLFRSTEADKQDANITRLTNSIADEKDTDKKSALEKEFAEAMEIRTSYRAASRIAALWTGLVIGLILAFAGVRILGSIFKAPDAELFTTHLKIFNLVDVAFTGIFIAGGSEAIHKITKLYNSFMNRATENNRQKTIKPDATPAG